VGMGFELRALHLHAGAHKALLLELQSILFLLFWRVVGGKSHKLLVQASLKL
jgi:hypothetical protein